MQADEHPEMGAEVWSRDEKRLGEVTQILGDYFRIQDDDKNEYWLRNVEAESIDLTRVEMCFDKDEFTEHIQLAPPDNYQESQYLDIQVTPDEMEQREIMLRELAAQRERMYGSSEAAVQAGDNVGEPVEAELARMYDDEQPPPGRTATNALNGW